MSNSYFQFKKFRIEQSDCAMKVSTEACILGAWVTAENAARILDIGTGTGLLSLMVAQHSPNAIIDAVELDPLAANQAKFNVTKSPWSKQINVIQADIFEFEKAQSKMYDLIISNPPFFKHGLKSSVDASNVAKHDGEHFDKVRFAKVLTRLLTSDGTAYVIYPAYEYHQFCDAVASQGLYCTPALTIYNQPSKEIFRIIGRVSRQDQPMPSEVFHIRDGADHTSEFNHLLRDYYLNL